MIQKSIYILSSCCINMSITLIGIIHHLLLVPLLFNILKYIFIRSLCVHYKPPFNTVQLLVLEFLMFNENTELIPPSESSDIYTGNYNPTEGIALALVGIYFSNQRFWA